MDSILVTGGTGSFGRAFIKHLLVNSNAQRICIYSRGEHQQAALRRELNDDSRLRWFVGDVRDVARLERAMTGVDAVIHAAALKRIETGQYNPDEMVKTNVLGTMNVIEAANRVGVAKVVGLSSDKAFQPCSPYGQSKALAESLLLAANHTNGATGTRYAVTRYGNVWASQGSVIHAWRAAQAAKQPILVTDPECTRFFMTMDEAVALVWNLLFTMQGGEIAIPDWLPAYRLEDLAVAFGKPWRVIGLPHWEKQHESMREGLCSKDVRRMSVAELKGHIKNA